MEKEVEGDVACRASRAQHDNTIARVFANVYYTTCANRKNNAL